MPRTVQRGATGDPLQRAREKADEMNRTAVKVGRTFVQKTAWARDLLEQMRAAAPNVDDEALYRLFSTRSVYHPEFLLGHARFLEYNATHRAARDEPAPSRLQADAAKGAPARANA